MKASSELTLRLEMSNDEREQNQESDTDLDANLTVTESCIQLAKESPQKDNIYLYIVQIY